MSNMPTIADTLRAAIDASDCSRAEIARAVGVTDSTISRLMAGGDLNSRVADALADYFGLELRPKRRAKKKAPRRKAGE